MPARTALRAGQSWDGLIVLCAVAAYDGIRMSDWHLAQHLSKLAPVLYVDPPSFRHPAARGPRRAGLRLRQEGPGLARLIPMAPPFPTRPAMAGTTAALIRRDLRWATARLGGQVSAVLSGWPQFPVFGACGERVRGYWAKDDFVAGAALFGLNAAMLQQRERQVTAAADLLIAANPVVAAMWRSRGRDPLLIPFGTDAAAYLGTDHAPLPPGISLPPPVAGFVGRLNARTDLALLEAIAARGRSLLLVGPKDPGCDQRRFAALQHQPNVHWAGQQPATALPGLPAADGRRPDPLHPQPVQPRQLPPQGPGIPGRRAASGRHRPARAPRTGHQPDPHHHASILRRPGRPPAHPAQNPATSSPLPGLRRPAHLGPRATDIHHALTSFRPQQPRATVLRSARRAGRCNSRNGQRSWRRRLPRRRRRSTGRRGRGAAHPPACRRAGPGSGGPPGCPRSGPRA